MPVLLLDIKASEGALCWDNEVGLIFSKTLSWLSGTGNVFQYHHQGGLGDLVCLLRRALLWARSCP